MYDVSHPQFQRQMILPQVGFAGQNKLAQAKVLVVGAGGLGCPSLQYLTAAGVGTIGIIDFDKVNLSNLHRQILFTPSDCGQNKALAAAEKLQQINPLIKINAYAERFTQEWAMANLASYDFVVDGTDNFSSKFLIHDLCFRFKKALVQAAIYQFEGQLQVFDFRNPQEPCLKCLWPEQPVDNCVNNCEQAGVLGVVPGFFGVMQATEVLKLILGLPGLKQGETLVFDLLSGSQRRIKWSKNAECVVCGASAVLSKTNEVALFANGISSLRASGMAESDNHVDEVLQTWNLWMRDCIWLDVRSEAKKEDHDYLRQIKVKDILHKPFEEIMTSEFEFALGTKMILFCDTGMRARGAAQILKSQGRAEVYFWANSISGIKLA